MTVRGNRGRIVAALLGVAFIVSPLTGRSGLLVRPWFDVVMVITGVVLIAVACLSRPSISAGAAFMLLLPLAVGLGLTPKVVGRISNDTTGGSALGERFGDPSNPLVSGKGGRVTLLQIRLAEEQVGGVYLSGRHVSVEAKVGGPNELERSVIVCCAADARTVTLPTSGATLPRSGTWVRVSGKLVPRGSKTILRATKVERIGVPSGPFL